MTSIPNWYLELRQNGDVEIKARPHLHPAELHSHNAITRLVRGAGKRFAGWSAWGLGVSTPSGEVRGWRASKPGLAGYVELAAGDGMPTLVSVQNDTPESKAELEGVGVELLQFLETGRAELLKDAGPADPDKEALDEMVVWASKYLRLNPKARIRDVGRAEDPVCGWHVTGRPE